MTKLDFFEESTPNDWRFVRHTDDIDDIVIGADCSHVFELPFVYEEVVADARAIYAQGLETLFVVPVTQDMVEELGGRSAIRIRLPASLTEAFDANLLDAYCQLEITTLDGETHYDKMRKLRVLKPLGAPID